MNKNLMCLHLLVFLGVFLIAVHGESAGAVPPPAIATDADGVTLQGKRTILLIGTLQPSRQDPADWDTRLATFEASGYNTVDCIVPWNFHEPQEGHFDFSSPTHDLPRFLRLCQKHHLYVFLRAGPYVCDEWDGGGLPAWLVPKPNLRLRCPQAAFLSYVRRWMHALDKTILPYQITRGGPVIWDQLENELDYFGPPSNAERHDYLDALRDYARQDGLDIPLTACVGSPGGDEGPLRRAMGLVKGVIPTGNFYGSGAVEARARSFINAVHRSSWEGGGTLAEVPVICSETGRDENTQRRLLAAGLKGIAPFNFTAGSNGLFNNGDTNWNTPVSYVSTSVDFGGMISFSGTRTPNWYAARRLAGFVHTVSDALCRAQSDTNWERGFSVSSPILGADEGAGQPRRVYRLAAPDGPQFVFLWNGSSEAQSTTVTVGSLTLPRHSMLSVAPHYDQILPLNVALAPWGLPGVILRYATGEIYGCTRNRQITTLTLTGNTGDGGEVSLSATPAEVTSQGAEAHLFADNGDWTAAFKVGDTRGLSLSYGTHRLLIQIIPRQELDTIAEVKSAPQSLLTEAAWHCVGAEASAPPARCFGAAEPPAMEQAGLLRGAAWYRMVFDAPPETGPSPVLSLGHAGDIVTAYLNGQCLGTQIGVGNEIRFDTGGKLREGSNALAVRVEIWGHSNFDDGRNPSLHLNSLRGIWGQVKLDDVPLVPAGGWRLTAEDPLPPAALPGPLSPLTFSEAGQRCWRERTLPSGGSGSPRGYVLQIGGKNVLGHLFVNGHPLGRFFFGPAAGPHLTGGPGNQFYVPAAWMKPIGQPNLLSLYFLATSSQAELSRADWAAVPAVSRGKADQETGPNQRIPFGIGRINGSRKSPPIRMRRPDVREASSQSMRISAARAA